MKMDCPQCSHSFDVSVSAHVPNTQRFSIRMTSEAEQFSSDTLGRVISATGKLFAAVAEEQGGRRVVFVESIQILPREATVNFLMVALEGGEVEPPTVMLEWQPKTGHAADKWSPL